MIRNIITINEDLCDGCGLCAVKCAEGALRILDGKARLVSEVYCDGLGACIGECPRGAITIGPREAPAFNEEAAQNHLEQRDRESNSRTEPIPRGCPGASVRTMSAPISLKRWRRRRSARESTRGIWGSPNYALHISGCLCARSCARRQVTPESELRVHFFRVSGEVNEGIVFRRKPIRTVIINPQCTRGAYVLLPV